MLDKGKSDFLWYSLVSNEEPLSQGDLLKGINVFFPLPPDTSGKINNEAKEYDLVVMTQSCDLVDIKNDDLILLCPIFPFIDLFKPSERIDYWKKLVAGRLIHSHLINKCEIKGHEFDYQVIDMKVIFTIQYSLLKTQINDKVRIRMLPPYREYMAQAFARQFMRIGLPDDLPREWQNQ